MVGALMIAAIMAANVYAAPVPDNYAEPYTVTARVTEYCPACNSPAGHGSATGTYLTAGHCAVGWLPMGSIVEIDGELFEVVDVCGTDAVDVFRDDDSGICHCDRNEFEEITVYEKR